MFFLVKFWDFTTCVEVAQAMQHYWDIVRKGLHWFQVLSTKSLNLLRKGEGCTFNFFCNLILLNKYYLLFLIQCFFFWETYSKKRKKKKKRRSKASTLLLDHCHYSSQIITVICIIVHIFLREIKRGLLEYVLNRPYAYLKALCNTPTRIYN